MQHKNRLSAKQLVTILTTLLLCTLHVTTSAQTTTEQLAEKALAATVYLEMQDSNGEILGIGSGFFVRQDLIVTNYHVIEGAARGTAKLVGKHTKYAIEGITATERSNDLAILKVSASGIKPLPLVKNSDRVKIGAQIYVAGNPKGLERTFSDGIISSKRGGYADARLQMTAPISPGSSGGPVLNTQGEVIGVSFMTIEGGQNLNFAIPSNYVKTLVSLSNRVSPLSRVSSTVSAETYFRRGYMKDELGDYQGAIAAYNSAIRLKPDDAEAYYNRGNGKDNLGQHNAAIADYDAAIRLKPDHVKAYVNRGVAKRKLGQPNAAIADYDAAIHLKPDDVKAYLNRGNAKVDLGQPNAAIADYDAAIHLKPDLAEAYYNRAGAKWDLGQLNAAIADYNSAIRFKPDLAEAYYNRAGAKWDLGQLNTAIADYDAAIQLKSDYAKAYLNRGVAKALLKRTLEAKQDLRTALRLAEKSGDARLKAHIQKTLRLLK